jgi:uncharacterized protein YqgQ
MNLEGLDFQELYDYTKDVFDNLEVEYDESLSIVLKFLNGHPDYSSQVLQGIYFKVKIDDIKMINKEVCVDVLESVIIENKAYLDELIIKAKQKKHHMEVLSAIANNKEIELNSRTLYNTHSSLEDMGLIKNTKRGKYQINDIFLTVLLQQKNDEKLSIEPYLAD